MEKHDKKKSYFGISWQYDKNYFRKNVILSIKPDDVIELHYGKTLEKISNSM